MRRSNKKLSILSYILIALIFSASVIFFAAFAKNITAKNEMPENTQEPLITAPTVVLDAGHGGEDGGAVGKNGVFEKELNLSYTLMLRDKLEKLGYKVILTRDTDTLLYDRNSDYEGQKKVLDMAQRLKIAKEYGDAIFISIHMNSFPQEKYSGLQVYYSPNNPDSQKLATSLQTTVRERLQNSNNRQIKSSGGKIFLLDRLCVPAILIECGFLSNTEECSLLCSDEYMNALTDVFVLSINGFLSEYNT